MLISITFLDQFIRLIMSRYHYLCCLGRNNTLDKVMESSRDQRKKAMQAQAVVKDETLEKLFQNLPTLFQFTISFTLF